MSEREARQRAFFAALESRILILDGARGYALRFLKGNNDLLVLTQPDVIAASTASTSRPARTSSRPTPSTRRDRQADYGMEAWCATS
jgi:methionine synthase I (cobalamin-dependent)